MKCPTCQAEVDPNKATRCFRCMTVLLPPKSCSECKGCSFHAKCALKLDSSPPATNK